MYKSFTVSVHVHLISLRLTEEWPLAAPLTNHFGGVMQGVVLELINQTRELRSELSEKEENLAQLSGDIKDITVCFLLPLSTASTNYSLL